eukprot:Colp12_sorted_trinity150504_noHs@8008
MTTESVPAAARVRQNQDDGVDEVIPGAATTFVVLKMADYEALLKGEPVADDVGNERFVMMANFGQGELMAVKDLYSEVPKKKKPDYVKRPLNAFFIWAKHEREQIKVMQQTCKIQSIDVSRHLGEKWKTMSEELQYKIRHSLRQAKGVIIRQQYAWML